VRNSSNECSATSLLPKSSSKLFQDIWDAQRVVLRIAELLRMPCQSSVATG